MQVFFSFFPFYHGCYYYCCSVQARLIDSHRNLYLCFLSRNDGSFSVDGLPSGSFLVEVANPTYLFENLRVDITSKGKIRARKVSLLQPTKLQTVQYPLEFRERGKASYFQQREQWRLTDFLFNPMVFNFVQSLQAEIFERIWLKF